MDMRMMLCGALLLLAGCVSETPPQYTTGETGTVPGGSGTGGGDVMYPDAPDPEPPEGEEPGGDGGDTEEPEEPAEPEPEPPADDSELLGAPLFRIDVTPFPEPEEEVPPADPVDDAEGEEDDGEASPEPEPELEPGIDLATYIFPVVNDEFFYNGFLLDEDALFFFLPDTTSILWTQLAESQWQFMVDGEEPATRITATDGHLSIQGEEWDLLHDRFLYDEGEYLVSVSDKEQNFYGTYSLFLYGPYAEVESLASGNFNRRDENALVSIETWQEPDGHVVTLKVLAPGKTEVSLFHFSGCPVLTLPTPATDFNGLCTGPRYVELLRD